MTGKSHILLGAAVGIVMQEKSLGVLNLFLTGASILGSMAPDLDHMKSKISRKVPVLSWLISTVFGHRGLLHSPLMVVILWIVLHNLPFGNVFVYGYIGHLFQDFFTKGGIPLLYPYKKRYSLPLVKTGGFMEYLLTILMIAGLYVIMTK